MVKEGGCCNVCCCSDNEDDEDNEEEVDDTPLEEDTEAGEVTPACTDLEGENLEATRVLNIQY